MAVACRAVAIGASAGGIHALQTLLSALPADFVVPILVVLHLDRRQPSLLAAVLRPHTPLVVKPAEHDEPLLGGTVYLGVPDLHLEVVAEHVVLASTPRVNFSRPSIDVLFHSMAAAYGRAGCGVVLSGAGRDGADGLAAIKTAGGTTIVQDPATAGHRGMPVAALATGRVDMTLGAAAIALALLRHAAAPSAGGAS